MLRFSLRQGVFLWTVLSFVIGLALFSGKFLPTEEQLLLGASDGVYLQQGSQHYYFFDESALPIWSPNGDFVALQAEKQFFLSDATSRVHFQMDLEEAERFVYRPVWSENSEKIAVLREEAVEGTYRLLIVDCQTGVVSDYDFPPAGTVLLWWVNADTLRFVTVTGREVQAWHYRLGDAETELLQSWRFTNYMVRNAVLNPDGQGFILPAITTTLQNFELYQFDMEGTVSNISNRATHNDTNPIWSPDGSRLAYRALGDSVQFIILQEENRVERIIGRFDNVFIRDMQWFDNETLSLISSYSGRSSYCSLDVLAEKSQCADFGMLMFGLSWRP